MNAATLIRQQCPEITPSLGIILGSGLDGVVAHINNPLHFAYQELPGFPTANIHGHQGCLTLGTIGTTAVACLRGRCHFYEGDGYASMITYVRTLKLLGCTTLLITNAAGSMRQAMQPGELMLITDHINLQGNPLVGPNDDNFGSRFPSLHQAYHPNVCQQLIQYAQQLNITLHQGVYIAVPGPSYETAAEIRAFQTLGADAVGMSTVPEVIIANHCGLQVGAISMLTNYATGLSQQAHDHQQVVATAKQACDQLSQLIIHFI